MKERAIELVQSRASGIDGVNLLREYVQSRMLGAMQEAGAMVPLAFMGGTALRFLYRTARFSEDLDFTLERSAYTFSFRDLAERLARQLEREGYVVLASVSGKTAVAKAAFNFVGLPAEAGISPHADEALMVKLEVDTRPPAGARLAVSLVDRFGTLRLQHHDMPSLFAGKIAAVVARPYMKGRDLYDLMWYLTRDVPLTPNGLLLGNALQQTAPESSARVMDSPDAWRDLVRERLATADWPAARRDVLRFLEQPRDIELIEAATFAQLLGEGR